MITVSFSQNGQETLRVVVHPNGVIDDVFGDSSWLDRTFTPVSETLQRTVSLQENPFEWARSLPAAYNTEELQATVISDLGPPTAPAQPVHFEQMPAQPVHFEQMPAQPVQLEQPPAHFAPTITAQPIQAVPQPSVQPASAGQQTTPFQLEPSLSQDAPASASPITPPTFEAPVLSGSPSPSSSGIAAPVFAASFEKEQTDETQEEEKKTLIERVLGNQKVFSFAGAYASILLIVGLSSAFNLFVTGRPQIEFRTNGFFMLLSSFIMFGVHYFSEKEGTMQTASRASFIFAATILPVALTMILLPSELSPDKLKGMASFALYFSSAACIGAFILTNYSRWLFFTVLYFTLGYIILYDGPWQSWGNAIPMYIFAIFTTFAAFRGIRDKGILSGAGETLYICSTLLLLAGIAMTPFTPMVEASDAGAIVDDKPLIIALYLFSALIIWFAFEAKTFFTTLAATIMVLFLYNLVSVQETYLISSVLIVGAIAALYLAAHGPRYAALPVAVAVALVSMVLSFGSWSRVAENLEGFSQQGTNLGAVPDGLFGSTASSEAKGSRYSLAVAAEALKINLDKGNVRSRTDAAKSIKRYASHVSVATASSVENLRETDVVYVLSAQGPQAVLAIRNPSGKTFVAHINDNNIETLEVSSVSSG